MLTVSFPNAADYNFSRNKMFVEIATDNYQYTENRGRKAWFYFYSLETAVVNDTMTIQFGVTALVYTFKAATNISGATRELAIIGGGQDVYEYITQVANDLMTDTALNPYVRATAYQKAVILYSLLAGTAYNLEFCTSDFGAGGYFENGTDDVQVVVRPNYRIQIEVFGAAGAGWEKIISISKEPAYDPVANDHKIRCDLAPYIDNHLEYDLPNFTSISSLNPAFKCTKVIKKFYTTVVEIFGNPAVEQSTTITGAIYNMDGNKFILEQQHVLKAGFDTLSAKARNYHQFDYYAVAELPGPVYNSIFLTRQPRVKKISRTQREWLYFLFHANVANACYIQFKFYDRHGKLLATTTALNTTPATAISKYDLWAFPVNRANGSLANNPDYYKQEVRVWNPAGAGSALSETFTYIVDEKYHPDEFIIHFTTSDGSVDTVRCVGANEKLVDFESEEVNRTLTVNDTPFDGDTKLLFVKKKNRYIVASGFRTRKELLYIEELFLSKKIFTFGNIYNDTWGTLVPLMVVTKTLEQSKTNRNLHRWVIELKDAVSSEISQAREYPIVQ